MQTSKEHIAQQLRKCLPPEMKETTWGYLAAQFPWYSMAHWLRAAEHTEDEILLQKAALFAPDILRLHEWLHRKSKEEHVCESERPSQEKPENLFDSEAFSLKSTVEASKTIEEATPENFSENNSSDDTTIDICNTDNQIKKTNDSLNELPLEPYHIVDYFASQGIKVDKTLPERDETQFDKQVKSFTDWLKTMKRLKYQTSTDFSDPLVEAKAKKSLVQKDIVTEAMAEVWAKQGNFSEATRVYARLMLLYPEKTPYFASRLNELNKQQ